MIFLKQIPSHLEDRYQERRNKSNIQGLRLASIIIFLTGLLHIVQHNLAPGNERNSFTFLYYQVVYFYCISGTLICLMILHWLKGASLVIQKVLLKIIFFYVISVGLALLIGDIKVDAGLSVFILTLLLANILYRESWKFTLLFYFTCFFIAVAAALTMRDAVPVYVLVQLLVYTLLSLFVWFGMESIRQSNFLMTVDLKDKILAREKAEKELKDAQNKLIETAHKAGMAEIAADVLHNIGNVLNSIRVSADLIQEEIVENPSHEYANACQLIRNNLDNISKFIDEDPKGMKLIHYLLLFEKRIEESFETIGENITRLSNKIEIVKKVVISQQSYIGAPGIEEEIDIRELIDSVLAMVPEITSEKAIQVIKDYNTISKIKLQKPRIIQVLLNLINNSVHALMYSSNEKKTLTISIFEENRMIHVRISDTGYGIPKENLEKVFIHGFTTKKDGFGFGLHSSANALNEMGAKIQVESEGFEKGSTFLLSFPLDEQ